MRPNYKVFVLSFSLLFPIIIYLFLRLFGDNKYEISLSNIECDYLVNNKEIFNNLKSNKIKIVDVRDGGKNYLINNHIKKIYLKKEIDIITISEIKLNLDWTSIDMNINYLDSLFSCNKFGDEFKSFIFLLDRNNKIRGLYNSISDEEIERLNVEIDILDLNNE